jgi:hypothetical protein
MWASTRSFARSAAVAIAAAATFASAALDARSVQPPELPGEVVRAAPELAPRGGGAFRWFGLSVYDAFFWSAPGADPFAASFALDLHYHRDVPGARIAERSGIEIAKLGYGSPEDRARWDAFMQGVFPDVRRGDRLTGLHLPGRGVRFFHNGRPIGESSDSGFARAFFAIWLDPRTSQPEFRRTLLGER